MPTIDEAVSRLRDATRRQPIDWETIRTVTFGLDCDAKTKQEKAAVRQLKAASDAVTVGAAIVAIERVFLEDTPDINGWPRRF